VVVWACRAVAWPHKTQYAALHGPASTTPPRFLFGPGLVECRVLQQPATVVDLDDVSVAGELPAAAFLDVFLAGVLGESPLGGLEDLLAAGELEFSPADGLDDVRLRGVLGADAEEDLPDVDARRDTDGLSVGVPHSRGKTIGPGAREHLVGAEDVEGVGADADVVGVLSDRLGQVLVDGDAAGLEGLGRDLLLLVADQVGDKWEEIDGGLLVSDVEDLDLGFRHTAAVPRLDVRLVLLVTVTTSWTATHGGTEWIRWKGGGAVR